jgi:SAM-dependent methyltransferase
MSKRKDPPPPSNPLSNFLGSTASTSWDSQLAAIAARFNQDYRREPFELPDEVKEMPIYQEWRSGILTTKLTSPFWQLAQPKKQQRVLDLGCGVSFLIYPWRDWEALFYGLDISVVARDTLNARGPQLNSKLFKGVELGAAHQLPYEAQQFDLAIATGFSFYYPLAYWSTVLSEVKRVLKPEGFFLFDVVDPETPLAENWAILETYLGAEVFLEPLAEWDKTIQATGKIVKKLPGELLQLYKVKFS